MLRALCLVMLSVGVASPARADTAPLVISAVPFAEAAVQERIFASLSVELTKALGRPVRFEAGQSYQSVVSRLGQGKIDAALVGAVAYVEARRMGNVRAILRSIRHGQFEYYGQFVVQAGSPIASLRELEGKTIAFVDTSSTSGWLYPRQLLRMAGLDPNKDVRAIMAGGHDKVVRMVANGEADAGACFTGAESLLPDSSRVVAIARTPRIPGDPVVVRAGLGKELVDSLRAALIKLAALPAAQPFFAASQIDAFLPAFDSDYDGVAVALGKN